MQKIIIGIILSVIAGLSAEAQITITQSNMPYIGYKFVYEEYYTDSSSIVNSPGSSGPSQTWNFSAMSTATPDTVSAISIGGTPYSTQFPGANLAFSYSSYPGGFEYYNSASTGLFFMGDYYVSSIWYSPSWEMIALPLTYKDHWAGTYSYTYKQADTNISGVDSTGYIQTSVYHDSVDAWGNITTPSGTYNSLRIKHLETDKDSSIEHKIGIGWVGAPGTSTFSNNYFAWYSNSANFFITIMDVDTTNATNITWFKNEVSGIDEITDNGKVKVFPNPANTILNIQTAGYNAGNARIYDLAGKEMGSTNFGNGRVTINTSDYSDGMYLYIVTDMQGNVLARDKFTVAR
ncbi:MAG: T9SS type A sorting domain-containing protein [Bacteroidia bacterium]